ncbi:MAG: glycosyltransferase, partial [Candidatus Curtissbacteria bacterium]
MAETARKIKVVIGEKNFNIGGIQRVALDLVRHLDKSKFEVFLITLQQWHDRGTFYDTVPVEVPIFRLNLNHWSSIREWYTLVRTLNHIKPDVVRSSSFFCNAVFRILQPLFGYRVIASEHNTMLQRGRLHTLANMLLSPMTYITVGVSQMVVDELAESGGFVRSKLKVIHNGIDLDAITRAKQRYRKSTLRTNLGLQPQDKVFLSVARFFKQKNHSLMIHAFKRLTELRDDCKLLLIGHGVLFEESRSLARSLGVEDRVIFLGEQREVYPFYVASDFFIMTS